MSKSHLWTMQNDAYLALGEEAWTKGFVPSYITSNPYIAKQYAQVVIGYLRGILPELNREEPIYLFDLGAGSGRLGYLFLNAFFSLLPPSLRDLSFRYVMTDISDKTLAYLRGHPYLQSLIEKNLLSFAYYHHTQKEGFDQTVNPVILLANYFFDTIPQDLFRVRQGKLEEGRITLSSESEVKIEHLQASYDYIPIDHKDYYDDPLLNQILDEYCASLPGCSFLFPIGGFESLSFFSKISKGRLLLLAGDQGVSTLEQIAASGEPKISKHNTFSIAVNYHSLSRYFHLLGGTGQLTRFPEPLFAIIAGVLGGGAEEMKCAFLQSIDAFEPKDYWKLVNDAEHVSMNSLLLLLKLGDWDPMNMHAFFPKIFQELGKFSEEQKSVLQKGIHKLWERFYLVSKEEGLFVMNLGVLLFQMGFVKDALQFFERAKGILGEHKDLTKNIAVCQKILFGT